MIIYSKAPCRLSLFGGGTDVDPFASEYGGKCLNIAINLRHECILSPSSELKVSYLQAMGGDNYWIPNDMVYIRSGKWDLISEILKSYKLPTTFRFQETFDGFMSAGLGSSASSAVAMIGAFNKWLGIEQTRSEIAEKAWQMEINLGWISGKQDQYASVYGGINFFEFDKKVWNEPIDKKISEDFVKWCLLVYTGKTRHSAKIQETLRKHMETDKKAIEALKKLRTQTWEAREVLKKGDYEKVGYLLDKSWELKKKSNPQTTNKHIDSIYQRAMDNGALGGKILGAGGEGCMLFIVEPKNRKEVLDKIKLKEIDFSIDYNGLETRSV